MRRTGVTLIAGAVLVVLFATALGLVFVLGGFSSHERQEQIVGILLGNHQYAVHCLAFAPDGKTLATGGGFREVPGEIKLWDLLTGTDRDLRGNQNGVYTVAFSPDGRTLAAASLDQVVRLWDVATGRQCASIPVFLSNSLCTVLAPDGKTLAVAGWGGAPNSVLLWHVAPETEQSPATGSGAVAFSADGRRVALWRLTTEPQRTSASLADGQGLFGTAILGDLPTFQIWDIPLGRETLRLRADPSFVWALAFSPDGRTLATGGFDETVKLWDVNSGQERTTLWGHTDQIGALAYPPEGHLLASGSHDGTVRLWDPATGQEIATLRGHTGRVTCVAFAPDGRSVASASHDRTVRLWPLAKLR